MSNLVPQQTQQTHVIGRIDSDHQEQTIDMSQLEGRMTHLLDLHESLAEASDHYSKAVKAAAEASGLLASSVRSFVAARASATFADKARKAQQLALIFETLGESPQQSLLEVDPH